MMSYRDACDGTTSYPKEQQQQQQQQNNNNSTVDKSKEHKYSSSQPQLNVLEGFIRQRAVVPK